jgi:hypothetical protein
MNKKRFAEISVSYPQEGHRLFGLECKELGIFGAGTELSEAIYDYCQYLIFDYRNYALASDDKLDSEGRKLKRRYLELFGGPSPQPVDDRGDADAWRIQVLEKALELAVIALRQLWYSPPRDGEASTSSLFIKLAEEALKEGGRA